jgi:hypothetical protein
VNRRLRSLVSVTDSHFRLKERAVIRTRQFRVPGGRLMTRYVAVGAVASSLVALSAGVTAAQAQPNTTRKATVVKVLNIRGFGRILETTHNRPLYTRPGGWCTGACRPAWPRLLMPRGKTIPLGTHCLGTAHIRGSHRLQVTYREHRLYTFIGDMSSTPTGDEQNGFEVAKALRTACPA